MKIEATKPTAPVIQIQKQGRIAPALMITKST
jgi:hypothetical protein